jgi:hypothetical protein
VLGLSNLYDDSAIQVVPGQQVVSQTWKTRGFMIQLGGMYHI